MEMNLNKLQDVVRDTEVWSAAVYGVSKSQKRINYWTTTLIFRELLWLFWVQATHKWENLRLPWWPSRYKSACQCRGHRFDPWSRKIPHATEQLSPCTKTKPVCLEPVLCNNRSHCNEKPVHCNEECPPLATTRESTCTATKTQDHRKRINKFFKNGRIGTGPPIWTPHHAFLLHHQCCYQYVPWLLVNW